MWRLLLGLIPEKGSSFKRRTKYTLHIQHTQINYCIDSFKTTLIDNHHTLKNAILVFSIRHQSSSFIFQISSFITQILLNIFQNYNLTKLVNSLYTLFSQHVSNFVIWHLSFVMLQFSFIVISRYFSLCKIKQILIYDQSNVEPSAGLARLARLAGGGESADFLISDRTV